MSDELTSSIGFSGTLETELGRSPAADVAPVPGEAPAELPVSPYTVLRVVTVPWSHANEIMHYGPCPDCGGLASGHSELADLAVNLGYADLATSIRENACPACGGKAIGERGPELGLRPHGHPEVEFLPGQTVHLTAEQARSWIEDGKVAPPGANLIAELRVAEAF